MTGSTNQVYPVIWHNDSVSLIDQTLLPNEYTFVEIHRSEDMARAIKTMIVRGAPAIGVAAAMECILAQGKFRQAIATNFCNT